MLGVNGDEQPLFLTVRAARDVVVLDCSSCVMGLAKAPGTLVISSPPPATSVSLLTCLSIPTAFALSFPSPSSLALST